MCVYKCVCVLLSHVRLLCDPMCCNLPGSSVHRNLQARILDRFAIPFSRRPSWHRDWTQVSHIAGRFFTIWATSETQYTSVFKLESQSCSVVSDSLKPQGLYSPRNSPGQNTGVGSLSLLQGISPTQGSNPGLPHCRQILYQLNHKGSPRILEWVAYPFSSGSSWPRISTGIPCIQADPLPTELSGNPYVS